VPVKTVFPGRYEDPQLIARGGMGEIYRAHDTTLGRIVAIKLLDDRFALDESVRQRFTREALAAARLSSEPSTVTIFDVGDWDDRPFIVMEYLPGGSLEDVLKRGGAQPPARVLEWLAQAAQALDHAHELGVVHRDVKPANLLLGEDERVRVADFGVASARGLDSLTQTGTIIGTAGYLSPEQASGHEATASSDCYALGVVAFELLAGSRPFQSSNATTEAADHVLAPPPSITERRPGLPPALDAVLRRAMAKNPQARYATCGEFVEALRDAFTRDAEPTRVMSVPVAPQRRGGFLLSLVLAMLLAAGILGAVLLTRRHDNPQTLRVTITQRGTTVRETVTQPATPPPTPPKTATTTQQTATTTQQTATTTTAASAAANGFAKMRAGDYTGALPLLQQAAQALQGSGSVAEAYNDFNLAFTLAKTQGCSQQVLDLLDESQRIQGHRKPIDDLRHACKHARH
jgi:eukaryotic-like serine/threonine-protein kinase